LEAVPFDLYWQDMYKVRDNITINYGIRYEYPSAIFQTRQEATNFIPGTGPVLLGTNQILAIDPTSWTLFSILHAGSVHAVQQRGECRQE